MVGSELLRHGSCIWMNSGRSYRSITRGIHTQNSGSKSEKQSRFGKRLVWTTLTLLGLGIPAYVYADYLHGKLYPRTTFQNFVIENKEFYSSTSSIFKVKAQGDADWSQQWERGLWSVEIKQPQLQIAREYTPLPECFHELGNDSTKPAANEASATALEFWIRREPSGELSNYLHKLDQGDLIEIRGPKTQVDIPEAHDIIFLAGGTGIGPAFQLAYALLARSRDFNDLPNLRILWANRRREDCLGGVSDHVMDSLSSRILGFFGIRMNRSVSQEKSILVERLGKLRDAFHGKLHVEYFVDEEQSLITKQTILSCLKSLSGDHDHVHSKRVIMVCGPDGFLSHFAGPREWRNGQQIQGQVAGVLKDVHQLGWEVIKL